MFVGLTGTRQRPNVEERKSRWLHGLQHRMRGCPVVGCEHRFLLLIGAGDDEHVMVDQVELVE